MPPAVAPQKQDADDDAEELEIAVDNTAFMDEFFSEVPSGGAGAGGFGAGRGGVWGCP